MHSYEKVLQFAIWNKGIATSIPKEQLPCMNKTQEKKNPISSHGFSSFTKTDVTTHSLSLILC